MSWPHRGGVGQASNTSYLRHASQAGTPYAFDDTRSASPRELFVASADADAARVLALTFTRAAAAELRERLAALGVREQLAAGTFHAVAYAQLRQRWADRAERAPVRVNSPAWTRVTSR